jgi:hypothetical protein
LVLLSGANRRAVSSVIAAGDSRLAVRDSGFGIRITD